MRRILQRHRALWSRKDFVVSASVGLVILAASLGLNYAAGVYASASASNAVTDLLLDHLPVVNVDALFVEGFAVFAVLVAAMLVAEPRRIPFVLKSAALFVLVRAASMSLTHIGPFPVQAEIDAGRITSMINFTGDLFFSGHTGLPFLMALVFWREAWLRAIFIALSALFAATVLLGHLHYSIDVFAAYFITYTVFHLAKRFFRADYALSETPSP